MQQYVDGLATHAAAFLGNGGKYPCSCHVAGIVPCMPGTRYSGRISFSPRPPPPACARARCLLPRSLAAASGLTLSLSRRAVVSHTLPAEQMRAVAGLGLALFAGFHGSKATARVVGNHVASRLGRPPLVRETSRRRSAAAAPKQQQRPAGVPARQSPPAAPLTGPPPMMLLGPLPESVRCRCWGWCLLQLPLAAGRVALAALAGRRWRRARHAPPPLVRRILPGFSTLAQSTKA